MLYLKPPYHQINGVTIFRDHEDPLQFYFLPAAPHLTVREVANGVRVPSFGLIKYRGKAGNGGFLNFDVNLGLESEVLTELRRELRRLERLSAEPRLAPVVLEGGSVRMMLFGKESPTAAAPGTGTPVPTDGQVVTPAGPQFVLKIDHAAKPALYGDNQAAFSVQLDKEGVTVLEQAMMGELSPIGVVYALEYLALRPAYKVHLVIDWERVQHHFEEQFKVSTLVAQAQIDKVIDELVERRVITLEADTFVPEGDLDEGISGRRDQAMNQVREMITEAFFAPSLNPFEQKKDGWDRGTDTLERLSQIHARGGMEPLFGYKRLDYTRIDRKSLNITISERTTVKRTIFPQGHLAGLFRSLNAQGVDLTSFVKEVDIDDPWFKRRRVEVISRSDFVADNLTSVNVRLRYGSEPQNVILDANKTSASLDWGSIIRDRAMVRAVDVEYLVRFKSSDAGQRPGQLEGRKSVFLEEQLEIDPQADGVYAWANVPVLALGFPWERYGLVEVHLRYNDAANGIRQNEIIRLRKDQTEGRWQRFVRDPSKTDFEFKLIFRANVGKDIVGRWTPSDEDQVIVRDPRPNKRLISVIPSFRWVDEALVSVDLSYRDPANHGSEQNTRLDFTADQRAPKAFVVDLENPLATEVQYVVTIVYNNDKPAIQLPPSSTRASTILVSGQLRGHRVIEVRPPTAEVFAKKRLKSITVALRYSDADHNLSVQDEVTFMAENLEPHYFEFDYADPGKLRYGYDLRYTSESNITRTVPDQLSAEAILRIPAPA
jgi:hypothetical protein